jgi:pyridoxine kinase
MKTVLSIQSHVAFGYVGNDAARFPLQRLGFDVIDINTVQFSNHTGYGDWEGEAMSADHIRRVLAGIERRMPLDKIDGFLTGYMGTPEIAEVILETAKRLSPNMTWLCDPVMGDVGRGMFVKEPIPDLFRDAIIPHANIITPNQFELEFLTSMEIKTLDDARNACRAAHALGPEIILLTSLIHYDAKEDEIQMLASHKNGAQYVVTTPRLPLTPPPNGAGDCTSALFLAHNLNNEPLAIALEKTASSIFALFEETMKAGTRELALIQAQDKFVTAPPAAVFSL